MNLLDKKTWILAYRKGLIDYLLEQASKDQETIVLEWFERGSKLTELEFLKDHDIVKICGEIAMVSKQVGLLEDMGILYLQSAYEDKQIVFESSLNRESETAGNKLLNPLNL